MWNVLKSVLPIYGAAAVAQQPQGNAGDATLSAATPPIASIPTYHRNAGEMPLPPRTWTGYLFGSGRKSIPQAVVSSTARKGSKKSKTTLGDVQDIGQWLEEMANGVAFNGLRNNIHPPGTASGCVVASPSTSSPDYFYHWSRDGALTMDTVVRAYTGGDRPDLEHLIWEYAAFSDKLLRLHTQEGAGEPKFHVDGSPFTGGWCRPQTDGPALIASTLVRFANFYLDNGGDVNKVREFLYKSDYPADSVIKIAIEYVADNWANFNTCDLWEEIRGAHFYTLMVQRRALREVAEFAVRMGDPGAAVFYRRQVVEIEKYLEGHWDIGKGYIVSTPNSGNRAGLDASLILAVIHTNIGLEADDASFGVLDSRVMSTIGHLVGSFEHIYTINRVSQDGAGQTLAPAIGRYAEDIYDGIGTSRGNPWYLCTAAMGEYLYQVAHRLLKAKIIYITPVNIGFFRDFLSLPPHIADVDRDWQVGSEEFTLIIARVAEKGDAFLRRVQYHSTETGGHLAEEYNRETGKAQGARDLTWSYASILTASHARNQMMLAMY